MLRPTAGVLILSALIFAISCKKADTPPFLDRYPQLPEAVDLQHTTSLPSDWGNLVSVTNSAALPDLMQLWLQDRDGTVRVVEYRLATRQILNVVLIRRR